ncbi:hypothetical protein MASR2M78_37250 [Treponema sp.]
MKKVALFLVAGLVAAYTFGSELSLNVASAYYIPSHGGYEADAFAPVNYSLLEGNEAPDARRDLGSTCRSRSQGFPLALRSVSSLRR